MLERNGEKAVPAKEVALKKIFDAFQNSTDAQRTYREVLYLRQMQSNEHVVKLLNVLKAENDRDLYLVFEYLETDLHAAICANILEEVHKQYIIHQAFKALTYMHSAGLVHRDMKPANLLLNADCVMKVADFGLARTVSETGEIVGGDLEGKPSGSVLTDYIATRWYRAPEVLVGSTSYGKAVDLWSLGCILGTRTHLPRLRPADSVSVPPLPSPSRRFRLRPATSTSSSAATAACHPCPCHARAVFDRPWAELRGVDCACWRMYLTTLCMNVCVRFARVPMLLLLLLLSPVPVPATLSQRRCCLGGPSSPARPRSICSKRSRQCWASRPRSSACRCSRPLPQP